MTHKILRTSRLTLKHIDFNDTQFIYEQFSDDFINKYLYDAEPIRSLDEAKSLIDFYTHNPTDMNHRYIMLNEDLEKIGTLGFHNYQKDAQSIEIGYDLKQAYNQKGYMKEALNELINYLQKDFDIKIIYACIYKENSASIRLIESLDFVMSGTKNEWFREKAYEHYIYKKVVN